MLIAAEILLFGSSRRNERISLIVLVAVSRGIIDEDFRTYFSLKAQNC